MEDIFKIAQVLYTKERVFILMIDRNPCLKVKQLINQFYYLQNED